MRDFSSTLVTVQQLFQGNDEFFHVPSFQRPYCWVDDEDVEDFLNDIRNSQESDPDSAYFIGGIVLAKDPAKANVYNIIDGQQRLMTTTIILAAAIDYYREIGQPEKVAFYQQYISHTEMDDQGNIKHRWKLTPSSRDKEYFYGAVYHDQDSLDKPETDSHKLIGAARENVLSFFRDTLKEPGTYKFLQYLLQKVKLVKTVASDMKTAFQIFQTLNDRGVSLGPEDLLKNLILSKVPEGKTDEIAAKWEKLRETLSGVRVKFSKLLRHYVMSMGFNKRAEDLFDWFEERVTDGISTMNELYTAAGEYCTIMKGPRNDSVKALQALRFVQAYVPLLAGASLKPNHYAELSSLLEKLAIRYVITRQKTNELEDYFCEAGARLRTASSDPGKYDDATVEVVLSGLRDRVRAKDEAFKLSLETLNTHQTKDRRRIRYLLARLAEAIEGFDYSDCSVEHVWPETPTEELLSKYGEDTHRQYVGRLGNLTLLKGEVNAALSNSPFSEKRESYGKSSIALTKSLAKRIETGTQMTRFDRALNAMAYEPPEEWGPEAIEARQKAYARLAMHVWEA